MKKKHLEIKRKTDCTGCRACEQLCPVNCITMKEDEEGFIFPFINEEKCINCGLCKKRCPQINSVIEERTPTVYAIQAKDNNVSKYSTSAGIAYLLAKKTIEDDGFAVGCSYNENLEPNQIMVNKFEELSKLRGSKYIFSNTMKTYTETKKALVEGKKVVYIGTPCQIGGLKAYLGKDYENLLTVDIICHGVPSKKMFKKYIESLQNKYNKKIINYEFRNKDSARWGEYIVKITFEDNSTKYILSENDGYYSNFLKGTIHRDACYECKYATTNRVGDLTVGDFWGIEQENPKFYSENGVSVVFANTDKGARAITNLENDIIISKQKIEQATKRNGNLCKPTKRTEIRDTIYRGIDTMTADEFTRKNLKIKGKFKKKIKKMIPTKVKNFIKRFV